MTLLMRDQENIEQGIKQGIEQGKKQGMEHKNREVIKNAYKMKMDIENIANLLHLSETEVEDIIKEECLEENG